MDNSFTSLVRKLNNISEDQITGETQTAETNQPEQITETANLLRALDNIHQEKTISVSQVDDLDAELEPVMEDSEELENSIQRRFAQFLKTETDSGTDIDTLRNVVDEGTAEYAFASRAFEKMQETIDTLSNMVAEGGKLGSKIVEAGGDASGLEEARTALETAKVALDAAKNSALGGVVEDES